MANGTTDDSGTASPFPFRLPAAMFSGAGAVEMRPLQAADGAASEAAARQRQRAAPCSLIADWSRAGGTGRGGHQQGERGRAAAHPVRK